MLTWFIIALAVGLVLVFALFWLLIRRLQVNWNKANRSAIAYLLPVFIALVFVFVSVTQLYPRLIDIAYIAADNLEIEDVVIDKAQIDGSTLKLKSGPVLIQHSKIPAPGTSVRLYITPYARHVIRMETVSGDQTVASGLSR